MVKLIEALGFVEREKAWFVVFPYPALPANVGKRIWADDSKYPGCAMTNCEFHPPTISFFQRTELGVVVLTAGAVEQDTLWSCVSVAILGVPAVSCGEQVSIQLYGLIEGVRQTWSDWLER